MIAVRLYDYNLCVLNSSTAQTVNKKQVSVQFPHYKTTFNFRIIFQIEALTCRSNRFFKVILV